MRLIFASCDYDNVITILVGLEEHRFIAHKDVICLKSKFFRAAFSDRWREGQAKVVRLPEVRSAEHFQMYMDWAYNNGKIIDEPDPSTDIISDLIEIFILGDVLQDVKLRNEILRLLNTLICKAKEHLNELHCHLIWDNTPSNSSLRKWTVDAIISSMVLAG